MAAPNPISNGNTITLAKLNGIDNATMAATVYRAASRSGISTSRESRPDRSTRKIISVTAMIEINASVPTEVATALPAFYEEVSF